jgi:hypothetical protein
VRRNQFKEKRAKRNQGKEKEKREKISFLFNVTDFSATKQ